MKVSKRQVAKLHNEAARHFNQKDRLTRLLEEAKSNYFKYRAIEQIELGPIDTVTLALIARAFGCDTIKKRRAFFRARISGALQDMEAFYDSFPDDFFKQSALENLWQNEIASAAVWLTIYLVRTQT